MDSLPPQWPTPTPVTVECVAEESARQAVDPRVLLAIKVTEGGKIGLAYGNVNGSQDLGPFQVNTIWIPEISRHLQMPAAHVRYWLANHGCFNVSVAAWILRQKINEAGGDLWRGVAHYHSRNPEFGHPYAWRVYRNLSRVIGRPAEDIVRASYAIPARK